MMTEDEPDHTHYCDDCDGELVVLYDERPDKSVPIVCGNCGGTNTRVLASDLSAGRERED